MNITSSIWIEEQQSQSIGFHIGLNNEWLIEQCNTQQSMSYISMLILFKLTNILYETNTIQLIIWN